MPIFLHGFLGQKEDWDPVLSYLPKDCTAIDLPGHGKAPFHSDIVETVKKQIVKCDLLVGYSAGGRLALQLKSRYPDDFKKVIIISAHLGHPEKKRDPIWLERLENSYELFLEKWYEQPLFQSLKGKPDLFHEMLERRKKQRPKQMTEFFKAFSPDLLPIPKIFPGSIFLFGEDDLKYANLYHKLPETVSCFGISKAGHALHLEYPKQCAEIIRKAL